MHIGNRKMSILDINLEYINFRLLTVQSLTSGIPIAATEGFMNFCFMENSQIPSKRAPGVSCVGWAFATTSSIMSEDPNQIMTLGSTRV